MTRSLRAFFLSRSFREEVLVVLFALILIGWWSSAYSDRAGQFLREVRHTSSELSTQTLYLTHRADIMAAAQQAASRFDAANTLNATELLTTVNNLAQDAGLADTQGEADADESNGQFSVHTLRFSIPHADWDSLTSFYLALEKKHPYIGIEQFTIQFDKNSKTHNVTMVLSSFEISKDNGE